MLKHTQKHAEKHSALYAKLAFSLKGMIS